MLLALSISVSMNGMTVLATAPDAAGAPVMTEQQDDTEENGEGITTSAGEEEAAGERADGTIRDDAAEDASGAGEQQDPEQQTPGEEDAGTEEEEPSQGEGTDDPGKTEAPGETEIPETPEETEVPDTPEPDGEDEKNPDEDAADSEEAENPEESGGDSSISDNTTEPDDAAGEKDPEEPERAVRMVTFTDDTGMRIAYDANEEYNLVLTNGVLEGITNADGSAVKGVVALPENKGITAIGTAFRGNEEITYVKLPQGVTSIQDNAFNNCYRLQGIYLPKEVERIGNNAFYRCTGLVKVAVPKKLASIGDGAFYGNDRLFMIYAQDAAHSALTSIGDRAFYQCKALEHFYSDNGFVVPGNLESIGTSAFFECKAVKSVNFNESVKTIGEGAFQECNALKEVVLSSKLEVISKNAFAGCNELLRLEFKRGNSKIGEAAFKGCFKLSALTILGDVRTIENYAFAECSSLTTVDVQNYSVDYGDSVFPNKDTLTLRGPKGSTTEEYTFGKKIRFVAYDEDVNKNFYKYTVSCFGPGKLRIRDAEDKDPNTLNSNKGVIRGTKLYVYVLPDAGCRFVTGSLKCNGEPLKEEKGEEGQQPKLYFEMPIGGAYFTAEFENIASSKKIQGADEDVNVEISNGDVVTDQHGEVIRVNLKAGQYTRMFLTDAKAEHKAIPSSKITYASSQKSVATVAADGTIHAIKAGQTDITAKVLGANDKIISRSVRVVVQASDATQIKIDAAGYDARLVHIETSSPGNIQTAVIDKDKIPREGIQFELKATVYDEGDESIGMTLKWSSSDAKVAKLSKASSAVGDPSNTVTVPAGTSGEATIRVTATKADKKTITQKFIVRVEDIKPRLVSKKLTVNPNRTDGALLQVLSAYGKAVDKDSVRLVKYDGQDKMACRDFELSYIAGESDATVASYRVTTSDPQAENKTYSVFVEINGGNYELPLKITVKSSKPNPKIAFEKKQPKLNYFYANDETEIRVNITSLGKAKVADYELHPLSDSEDNKKFTENFEVEYIDQDTCVIRQKNEELACAKKTGKPVVTGYLRLYYEDYASTVYTNCKITVPSQRKAPSYKLNRTSDTFRKGCGEQEIELQLVDKKNKPVDLSDGGYVLSIINDGIDNYIPVVNSGAVDLDEDGCFTMLLKDNAKNGKVKLRLTNSSLWAQKEKFDFTYSVKMVDSVPKISLTDAPGSTTALKSSTVSLNPNYPQQTVEFGLKSSQKGTEIADEQVFKEKTTNKLAAFYQYLEVQYTNGVGSVTVLDSEAIKDGTYTYVCDKAVYLLDGDERYANKVTLKVKVKQGNPTVTVKGSLKLNNEALDDGGNFVEKSELTLAAKNLPDGYAFDLEETIASITCKTKGKAGYEDYFDWELIDREVGEDGKITEGKLAATMNRYCEKGTYKFSIKPAYSGDGDILYAQKAVNFTLKIHNGEISIALSPKGKINLLARSGEFTASNSIVYTPSLKNIKDKVVEARVYDYDENAGPITFDASESDLFEAQVSSDGKVYVRPKEDAPLKSDTAYKIYIWTGLENYKFPDPYGENGGGQMSKLLTVKTAQTLPKVTTDRSSVDLYLSNKNYVATFVVKKSEAKAVGNVESIAFGKKDTNAQESFVATEDEATKKNTVIGSEQLEDGSLLVRLQLRDTVLYGCNSTNKITMYVRFEGQGTNTPGTEITMNVKINK